MAKSEKPKRGRGHAPAPVPGKPKKARRADEWDPQATPAATAKAPAPSEATEVNEAHALSGITAAMLEAQKRVHERLTDSEAVAAAKKSGLVGPSNIVGSYIGEKWSHGRPTGHIGVVMMVRHKHAEEHICEGSRIPDVESVDGDDVPVDVREFGQMRPYQTFRSFQTRESPALHGASISLQEDGNGPYETGSYGCLCLVQVGDREKVCLLSNNHILANHSSHDNPHPNPTAPIVQQGGADPNGGDAGVVGHLLKFVPLDLSADSGSAPFTNRVDAAVAITRFEHFHPAFHHPAVTFDPSRRAATMFMVVMKEGRTTGTTKGMVIGLNATIGPVGYGPGGSAPFGGFTGQILVEGLNGLDFSQPGDSGSLICGLVDGAFHPVALLVGGGFRNPDGSDATFGCPIDEVMEALNINEILDRVDE